MMSRNKLMIASAGAGKTTYLVEKALDILEKSDEATLLITTYTRSNAKQIREKIRTANFKRNGVYAIPSRLYVQEWFTFLLREGVRPFKAIMHEDLKYQSIGLYPDFQYNGNLYIKAENVLGHYFVRYHIIRNALAEFAYKANEKAGGEYIERLSAKYSFIFIDEVQDLAGYDLELISLLIDSPINVLLVGDPRQVTYLTNHAKINSHYRNGRIADYLNDKCAGSNVIIDAHSLKYTHRNDGSICEFSSRLYPTLEKSEPCTCVDCHLKRNELGVFVIKPEDLEVCLAKYGDENVGVLRWQNAVSPEITYGDSKGLTFDRVVIYPTGTVVKYLKDGKLTKEKRNKKGKTEVKDAFDIARFYVAVTRARYSVFIVYDYKDNENFIDGVQRYHLY